MDSIQRVSCGRCRRVTEDLDAKIEKYREKKEEAERQRDYHGKAAEHFEELDERELRWYAEGEERDNAAAAHFYDRQIHEFGHVKKVMEEDSKPEPSATIPEETAEGQHAERKP